VAVEHVQQSALELHIVRQAPSTQLWPLQSAFDRQLGCGLTSGTQSPCEHMSCAGQSLSMVQAPWQKPLMQVSLAGHELSHTQAPPPVALGWQVPFVHASPVPQSDADLQAGWQSPSAQRPPTPHSLL
jgi:hypothetical protein